MNQPLRILLADDHTLVRHGFRKIVEDHPGWQVVAECGDGGEAVRLAIELRPDVAVLDIGMPHLDGVEATRQITRRAQGVRVLILSMYSNEVYVARALQAGAKAYILKDIAAEALVACIRDVLAGKTYLAPAAAAKLAERVTQVQLTPRELATLRLMANGQSNKEIASALEISARTVKTHLTHLFEKLGVTSRTEAVRVATRRGLVRFD